MSEALGHVSFPEDDRREIGRRPYSKRLANAMDGEARNIIARAYKRTETLLLDHRDMLEKVLSLVCPLGALSNAFAISSPRPCSRRRRSTTATWKR